MEYIQEGVKKFVAGFTFDEVVAKAKKIFPSLKVGQAIVTECYETMPKLAETLENK